MSRWKEIRVALFDYGGVLAEEGFREGLMAIGEKNHQDPEEFAGKGFDIIHRTGYVTGHADEAIYWEALRKETGIRGTDRELRAQILGRFVLRPWMLDLVAGLRKAGLVTAILSDQTQWLDELDKRDDFFKYFDYLFNSYYVGMSKRDPALFDYVADVLSVRPPQILFIDDHPGNIERAGKRGYRTHLYKDKQDLMETFGNFFPGII